MPAKLIRITTVPMALAYPLKGQPSFMHKNGMDVIMISAGGKELPVLCDNETCPHIIVPMTRKITPWQDIKCLFKLIRIFKKEQPDIVHTETPKAGLLGMLAAKLCHVRIRIHTVAGLPLMVEKGVKLWVLQQIEKITYAAATNVWPNSFSLKNYILQNKFTHAAKLTVVGKGSSNGVDTYRFNRNTLDADILRAIKLSLNYNAENIHLLFVGRMVSDKGIVELVNVFRGMYKENPLLRLILLGHYERSLDPLPEYIETEIKENPAIIHINWTDAVEYYLYLAHIFVFPSRREGFPNVLLEAAAMKLPIICSGITGNTDMVKDHETGLLFKSRNETELKNKIILAVNEPGFMKEMAVKLYKIITTTYKRERFWQSMFLEYKKLL